MSTERIAVVVVTYHSAAVLPGLLASLPAGLGGLDWQLLVADNDSGDGSGDVVRALAPTATVVDMGRNAGYAAGINAAVAAAADHTAILVLNPDVRLAPGCVPRLLTTLREPGVGIAVPHLVDADGELITSMRRAPSLWRAFADALLGADRAGRIRQWGEVVTDPDRYRSATDTDWAEGSTQLVSADCWQRCGGWDESYFLYSEEADFHLRAGASGCRVRYDPRASAVHLEGDSGTSPALWSLLVANRLRFFGRRHSRPARAAFWLALVLREASRAARGSTPARAALRVLLRPWMLAGARGPEWLARV